MGGAALPPCYLFGLRLRRPGVYRLYSRAIGDLQEDLHQDASPRTVATSAPCLLQAKLPTHAPAGEPQALLWGHCSFPLGPGAYIGFNFLCPSRVESLFLPVPWRSCNQITLDFKVRFPGDSQSLCQIPRLGRPMWDFGPSQQCKNVLGIIVLQFVGRQSSGYRIWFYHDCSPPTILLWFLLCPWMWDVFLWWVQCLSVDGCSTSCDCGVLAGDNECMSFYSGYAVHLCSLLKNLLSLFRSWNSLFPLSSLCYWAHPENS